MGIPLYLKIFFIILVQVLLVKAEENKDKDKKPVRYQPEQVHLAYGKDATEMVVTWSTMDKVGRATVIFGKTEPTATVLGNSKLFVDGGKKKRSQYIHRVKLTGLEPATKYVYICGSHDGWSDQFWFRTANDSIFWSPVVAVLGDMGNKNARSLPFLQLEAQTGSIDAVIHVGDLAYDMDTDNGKFGDEFMRQIEPIAAHVPYMVCPGNHEEAYNFSHYRERFTMPGDSENLFYSFNLGPAHFLSFTSEAYYFLNYGFQTVLNQFNWIKQDLKEADSAKERTERPWIVAYGHRPMYYSNYYPDDEEMTTQRVRVGIPGFEWLGLEKVFYDARVDLELYGHQHSYERMFPLYDFAVKNGSVSQPYVNPKAPVHITTGSAGCEEGLVNFTTIVKPWSAFRNLDYGFAKLHFVNHSHLHVQQLSVDQEGKVIDDIWIVKDGIRSY
ncbi:acid phosphatase type 7 [Halyomorpha halys]|uniref:acid phosphatase type 7 n=1 Tax=Halyomorpha halys TaxID=286706 RepID=UPI0006D4CA28|nr:acid phosphatase type 7-like [Halyomorpha halys]XP_014275561.1 acid phosphatase type 7-like [Halyomorpha halys]